MLNYQPQLDNEPIIVKAYRTPIVRAFSSFSQLDVIDLIVPLLQKITENIPLNSIDEVMIGNATSCSGNIARLGLLSAGLPIEIAGTTLDKQCGSGLETVVQACRNIQAGAGQCYIAGGVESVSTAPWRMQRPTSPNQLPQIMPRARFSPDFLGDPDMGIAAENVAKKCQISRERQDKFALQSHQRAISSIEQGLFKDEIVPIQTAHKMVDTDECPRSNTSLEKLASLSPAFLENGTVTAGNACPINDGAAVVLIMSRAFAKQCGFKTGLRFLDSATAGVDPNYLGLGPIASTQKLLKRQPSFNLDLANFIEFNEAFASQVLACLDNLHIDEKRVNLNGGALALGHPYGASGTILTTRLFSQMVTQNLSQKHFYGLAMLGIAGGLGTTVLFDNWRNK